MNNEEVKESTIYILGAGAVNEALTNIAAVVGFPVKVIDYEAEKLDQEKFPHAQLICFDFDELMENPQASIAAGIDPQEQDYICVITRGHRFDNQGVVWALGTNAHYIGMMGSAKHIKKVREFATQHGRSNAELDSIHMPIGIDINAKDAAEIGLSVAAQIVADYEARLNREKDHDSLHRE